MPFNPLTSPKRVAVTTTAISINESGRMSVTGELRNPRKAWAQYTQGGASGDAVVSFVGFSGVAAVIQFSQAYSGAGPDYIALQPVGSGVGFSGGTLTVWFEGD